MLLPLPEIETYFTYNSVTRMKYLILLFTLISTSLHANLIMLSAYYDQARSQIIFNYGDGVEDINSSYRTPSTVSFLQVCVNSFGPGVHAYASDLYCTSEHWWPMQGFSSNYGTWDAFQRGIRAQRGLGTSGSMKMDLRRVNANTGTPRYTCWVYEVQGGRLSSSCVTTQYKSFATSCDITGPSILDHGLVDGTNVTGNTAKITATVSCSSLSTVIFSIAPDNGVSFYNGIQSTITVDGQKYPSPKSVNGSADFEIASTLSLTGSTVKAGAFSGSAVIVVDVI